jgi:hypothetical protein
VFFNSWWRAWAAAPPCFIEAKVILDEYIYKEESSYDPYDFEGNYRPTCMCLKLDSKVQAKEEDIAQKQNKIQKFIIVYETHLLKSAMIVYVYGL